jgi:hypothetical protein
LQLIPDYPAVASGEFWTNFSLPVLPRVRCTREGSRTD